MNGLCQAFPFLCICKVDIANTIRCLLKRENNHRYVSLNNHFLLFLQYERTDAQLCECKVLT